MFCYVWIGKKSILKRIPMSKRDKIIDAAYNEFIKKGFLAGSMGQIAKAADVNKSLLYHHFTSKEDLWNHVKKRCFDENSKNLRPIRDDTLENFIEDLIDIRVSVYAQKDIRSLIHWQSLHPNTSDLYTGIELDKLYPFQLITYVESLQRKKMIHNNENSHIIAATIFCLTSYAYFDFADAYEFSENLVDDYKKFIKKMLMDYLNISNTKK